MSDPLIVHDDVRRALAAGRAVVALESTVISHGLPRPRNHETALEMEATVRRAGAQPATIGILGGSVVVGLTEEQIGELATRADVAKTSRRDLAAVVASGAPGATTVATTAWAAARSGIRVMATGGIGGVHRGAEQSWDVSADLRELAETPVAVVCAGAKAILDLPRTLEVLETLGVPVVGYRTDDFPAFYSRRSGLDVQHRVDSPLGAARLIDAQRDLGLSGGLVIAQPPPADQALPNREVEAWIGEAEAAAAAVGITGNEVTPFLLERIAERSGGRTLTTNVALLLANAELAAGIAAALRPQS